MSTSNPDPNSDWAERWLDAVASGEATMSQRRLSSVETRGGGLDSVASLARARGVHLVVLTDDQGNELVAASKHPFRVVC